MPANLRPLVLGPVLRFLFGDGPLPDVVGFSLAVCLTAGSPVL